MSIIISFYFRCNSNELNAFRRHGAQLEHLKEIEEILAPYEKYDAEFEKGKITHCSVRWDYLTVRVLEELNGRYYRIMYPGRNE